MPLLSRRSFLINSAAVLGLTALTSQLVGCAPKEAAPAPAAEEPVTKPEAPAPAAPEGITLRYLAYQGRWGTHQVEFANRYAEDNKPAIKEVVIEEASFDEAAKKVEAYFVAGTMPDAGYLDTAFFPYLAYKGCFQAIDDLAASAGVDLSERFNQAYFARFTDGKNCAIGGASGITPAMIVYNKTMVQEKGVPLPHNDWTVDDFEEFCARMTDENQGIFGSHYGFGGSHGHDGWWRRWGGRLLSEDGTTCMFAEPATQDAFRWQMRMVEEGYWPTRESAVEGAHQMFVTGALASYVTNAGLAGSAEEGIGDRFEYDFVLLPKGPLCETADPCRGFSPYANAIWSSSQTQYPEHAFGLQKYTTSIECSLWSVWNLGRNPGSDMRGWRDPEVLAKFPIWGHIADLMENPAGRFPMPDNFRYLEYMDVGNAEYGALGWGDVEYHEENVMLAQNKVQAILDMGRP